MIRFRRCLVLLCASQRRMRELGLEYVQVGDSPGCWWNMFVLVILGMSQMTARRESLSEQMTSGSWSVEGVMHGVMCL